MYRTFAPVGIALSIVAFLPASAHAQKLTSATISFFTPKDNDNKDEDTAITVVLSTKQGEEWSRVLAKKERFDGNVEYKDNDSTHTKDLEVQGNITKADINGVKVRVEVFPNGNDRWIFRYDVELKFDNGTVLKKSAANNIILDQNNRVSELVY